MPDGMIKQLVKKREIYSFKLKQDQGGRNGNHTQEISQRLNCIKRRPLGHGTWMSYNIPPRRGNLTA